MKKTGKKILLLLLLLVLLAELAYVAFIMPGGLDSVIAVFAPAEPTAEPTAVPTEAPTETATETPTEVPTEAPTEAPTEPPTEPQPESFLLTFAGDCTFGSTSSKWSAASSFVQTIGENYEYPFANLAEYFANDDFTMINLEGPLTEGGSASQKLFAFRGPVAYTQIMTSSSVEAVTLANNHSMDYGADGYNSTLMALDNAGISYVEENKTKLYTTESGLVIGLYADSFSLTNSDIQSNIAALKEAGAEVIVCAFHWGTEGSYRPTAAVQDFAHVAIDAGAHVVYGHHPHVLQKIEEYDGGIIYYSLGNCSFGGSANPRDYDSAIVQQEIIREPDGTVHLGQLTRIPISVSSVSGQNNYQPTPLEEGSDAYNRVLSKLDGSFTGPDLKVDYSGMTGSGTSTASADGAAAAAEG